MEFLRQFAGPTGARASIVLMSGGLILLGFLFATFMFRSAIVGDVAPAANDRGRTPRVALPPPLSSKAKITRALPGGGSFEEGRKLGREAPARLDQAFDAIAAHGAGGARVMRAWKERMHVRVYHCASCEAGHQTCAFERGLLVGALESVTGMPVKAHETACRRHGAPACEFIMQHAAGRIHP